MVSPCTLADRMHLHDAFLLNREVSMGIATDRPADIDEDEMQMRWVCNVTQHVNNICIQKVFFPIEGGENNTCENNTFSLSKKSISSGNLLNLCVLGIPVIRKFVREGKERKEKERIARPLFSSSHRNDNAPRRLEIMCMYRASYDMIFQLPPSVVHPSILLHATLRLRKHQMQPYRVSVAPRPPVQY